MEYADHRPSLVFVRAPYVTVTHIIATEFIAMEVKQRRMEH
jgi:hypothetical protein